MRNTVSGGMAALLLSLLALPASATSYVMMSDSVLVSTSPVISEVTILEASPAAQGGLPFTDYRVRVEQALKGSLPETIVVRVPGGIASNGLQLRVHGVPHFTSAERSLLFLAPREDGTYGLHHLGLGVFRVVEEGGSAWAVRDLGDALVLDQAGSPLGAPEQLRDFDRFARWLKDSSAGLQRMADYLVPLPASRIQSIHDQFTLFVHDPTGLNMRWPDFDLGDFVEFVADAGGQPGVPGGGFAEFSDSLDIWTDDAGSNIDYRYGGTVTGKTGGLTDPCDGTPDCQLTNAIIYEDPNGFIGTPFNCSLGVGVIAAGGPWFNSSTTHQYRNDTYITIQAADIVVNQDAGCFLATGRSAEEVYTHELGHTLGIGHSCNDPESGPCDTPAKAGALMNAIATGGNRGGDLGTDDQAAAAFLYTPAAEVTCLQNPSTLCLQGERFAVTANWRRSNGTSGVGTAVELTPDTGYFWFFNETNVEMIVKVLDACTSPNPHFWVFAGGLTNVEVELTVTDTETGIERTYTNPLSTPFQPIQDTSAFATCP